MFWAYSSIKNSRKKGFPSWLQGFPLSLQEFQVAQGMDIWDSKKHVSDGKTIWEEPRRKETLNTRLWWIWNRFYWPRFETLALLKALLRLELLLSVRNYGIMERFGLGRILKLIQFYLCHGTMSLPLSQVAPNSIQPGTILGRSLLW